MTTQVKTSITTSLAYLNSRDRNFSNYDGGVKTIIILILILEI